MNDAETLELVHDALMQTVARMELLFVQAGSFEQLGCGVVASTKIGWCDSTVMRMDALTQRLVDLGGQIDYGAKPELPGFADTAAQGHLDDLAGARALVEALGRLAARATEIGDDATAKLAEAHAAEETKRMAWTELELRELERLGEDEYRKTRATPPAGGS